MPKWIFTQNGNLVNLDQAVSIHKWDVPDHGHRVIAYSPSASGGGEGKEAFTNTQDYELLADCLTSLEADALLREIGRYVGANPDILAIETEKKGVYVDERR